MNGIEKSYMEHKKHRGKVYFPESGSGPHRWMGHPLRHYPAIADDGTMTLRGFRIDYVKRQTVGGAIYGQYADTPSGKREVPFFYEDAFGKLYAVE